MNIGEQLTGGELDVLRALFMTGPLWDGNVPSKTGRNSLVEKGLADRVDGFTFLTRKGVVLMVPALGDDKT